ncbi:MAG: hypothetical protein ACP5DZ_05040 [Bacteroidales bacterium]
MIAKYYDISEKHIYKYNKTRRIFSLTKKDRTSKARVKVDRLEQMLVKMKKTIRVEMAGNKKRSLKVLDEEIYLKGYEGTIRQISITGHGKINPAVIITNDFDLKIEKIVRKYAK